MPPIREGRWDCSCGLTLRGSQKFCPNCGRSSSDFEFYAVKGAPEVIGRVSPGPDWKCEHCSSANVGDSNYCDRCGAPKGSSPVRQVKEFSLDEIPYSAKEAGSPTYIAPKVDTSRIQSSLSSTVHSPSTPSSSVFDDTPRRSSSSFDFNESSPVSSLSYPRNWWKWLLGVLGIAVVVVGLFLFFQPHEVPVTVDGFEWSRTIHIDAYQTYRESDWSVPAGGRQVGQPTSRYHHTDKIYVRTDEHRTTERYISGYHDEKCGETNLGDGYFEDVMCPVADYAEREVVTYEDIYRYEDVYEDWYTYDIDRWGFAQSIHTLGSNRSDPAPYWGEFALNCAGQAVIGCERENRRDQLYTVYFIDAEGERYSLSESQSDWELYEQNGQYTLVINGMGIQNDPLRPETEE